MCTAAHFRVKSVSGAVPLSQILLEDGGRTVLLEPAEELAFQTVSYRGRRFLDLMDIHGLEQDKAHPAHWVPHPGRQSKGGGLRGTARRRRISAVRGLCRDADRPGGGA